MNCPHCKKEIEIWSDELEVRCHFCGKTVKRTDQASCLDWCKYEEKCVGEAKYKEYIKKKNGKAK